MIMPNCQSYELNWLCSLLQLCTGSVVYLLLYPSTIIAQAKEKIHEAEHRCNQAEQESVKWQEKFEKAQVTTTEVENKCLQQDQKIKEFEKRCSDLGNIRNNLEEKYARTELELIQVGEQKTDVEEKLSQIVKEKRNVDKEVREYNFANFTFNAHTKQ